jgi:hypothetical protein
VQRRSHSHTTKTEKATTGAKITPMIAQSIAPLQFSPLRRANA